MTARPMVDAGTAWGGYHAYAASGTEGKGLLWIFLLVAVGGLLT